MAIEHLKKTLQEMGLKDVKRYFTKTPEAVIDHSGLVVIPFWIIVHGLRDNVMSIDESVEVPGRNSEIIISFLEDLGSTGYDQWLSGISKGDLPYAFILNTKEWDRSGLFYLTEGQKKVRLRTKSKKKPDGYLITVAGGTGFLTPRPNEVDGINFIGTNYVLKKTPFRLTQQYKWSESMASNTTKFTTEFVNSLLK